MCLSNIKGSSLFLVENTLLLFYKENPVGANYRNMFTPNIISHTHLKVLCYKSERRWFDPSWCQWDFSLT